MDMAKWGYFLYIKRNYLIISARCYSVNDIKIVQKHEQYAIWTIFIPLLNEKYTYEYSLKQYFCDVDLTKEAEMLQGCNGTPKNSQVVHSCSL